jgi:hypothetical protein
MSHRPASIAVQFWTVFLALAATAQPEIQQTYSKQNIICLDPGEQHVFALKDGRTRTVRLVSIEEHRDTVVHRVRQADVTVQIEGEAVRLSCGPYVMPSIHQGLRIQADSTKSFFSVYFKGALQAIKQATVDVDFGDGQGVSVEQPGAEFTHTYKSAGLYIITSSFLHQGQPIRNRIKVTVTDPGHR